MRSRTRRWSRKAFSPCAIEMLTRASFRDVCASSGYLFSERSCSFLRAQFAHRISWHSRVQLKRQTMMSSTNVSPTLLIDRGGRVDDQLKQLNDAVTRRSHAESSGVRAAARLVGVDRRLSARDCGRRMVDVLSNA